MKTVSRKLIFNKLQLDRFKFLIATSSIYISSNLTINYKRNARGIHNDKSHVSSSDNLPSEFSKNRARE